MAPATGGRRRSLVAAAAAAAAAVLAAAAAARPSTGVTVATNASLPSWRHHPLLATHPTARPALLATFWYTRGRGTRARRSTAGAAYVPGGGGGVGAAFAHWDTLALPTRGPHAPTPWLALTLRRPAVVCGVAAPTGRRRRHPWLGASLVGWPGTPTPPPGGGPPAEGVWCRQLPAGGVRLPSPRSVRLPSGRRVATLTLVLAEAGGAVPTYDTAAAAAVGAVPGGPCPAALHDAWTVTVEGRTYATYHPAWDPLFHCSYGHEHGSAPYPTGRLPALDYTAHKNDQEEESHPGFKFYRFSPAPGVLTLLSLHFDANQMSRVLKRFHTVSITVVRAAPQPGAPPELLMDVSYKGDFGFAFTVGQEPAAPGEGTGKTYQLPLGAEEAALRRELRGVNAFRKRFNVANATDGRLERAPAAPLPRLRTEHWRGGTGPCSTLGGGRSGFSVDMADPPRTPSAVDAGSADAGVALPLAAHPRRGPFLALRRALAFDGTVTLGAAHCPGGPPATAADGVFYTDPFGRRVVDGPCGGCVRQTIAGGGWSLPLRGRYGTDDH